MQIHVFSFSFKLIFVLINVVSSADQLFESSLQVNFYFTVSTERAICLSGIHF